MFSITVIKISLERSFISIFEYESLQNNKSLIHPLFIIYNRNTNSVAYFADAIGFAFRGVNGG